MLPCRFAVGEGAWRGAGAAVDSVSACNGINYLLFRLFEAAKQLDGVASRRVAVAVVEDLTWWRVDSQLKNQWLDWTEPQFLSPDVDWKRFISFKSSSHQRC